LSASRVMMPPRLSGRIQNSKKRIRSLYHGCGSPSVAAPLLW
jgi:hypothetical protein